MNVAGVEEAEDSRTVQEGYMMVLEKEVGETQVLWVIQTLSLLYCQSSNHQHLRSCITSSLHHHYIIGIRWNSRGTKLTIQHSHTLTDAPGGSVVVRRVVRVCRRSCDTVICVPTIMYCTSLCRSSRTTMARSEEKASEKAALMVSIL